MDLLLISEKSPEIRCPSPRFVSGCGRTLRSRPSCDQGGNDTPWNAELFAE
jgi:hypothetical protein